MSREVIVLSTKEMAERKRQRREADERALKNGDATPAELQRRNSIFAAFPNARVKPTSGHRAP